MSENKKKTILAGMRPTGALHLGHYVGVLKNVLKFQDEYNCFFFIADWHALTALYGDVKTLNASRIEYVKGWLASGIDPEKVTIYNQSDIPEVLSLSQVFQCLTPPGWADRSPSWKDHKATMNNKIIDNLGFYTYPVLQAADIALVKGELVPVGEDQLTHLEIAREIIRKFNRTFNGNIPAPEALLTKVPKLPGLNGQKMSSSKGNTISLQETEKSLQKKVNKMKTDDERGGVENPGNPDNCSVYDYHKVFSAPELCHEVGAACRKAQLSCGECKAKLGGSMKEEFMPISERFRKISDKECLEILDHGTQKAQKEIAGHWENISETMKWRPGLNS